MSGFFPSVYTPASSAGCGRAATGDTIWSGPFITEHIQEELSYAYIHAIASACRFSVSRDKDLSSVDLTVRSHSRLVKGGYARAVVDFQVKATHRIDARKGDTFALSLKLKNYEELRQEAQAPTYLVVYLMPKSASDWLVTDENALVARKCAYWASLLGLPVTKNKKNVTVYVPWKNVLNLASMRKMMVAAQGGKSLH